MTLRALQSAALRLAPRTRVELAHSLVASLSAMPPDALQELWLAESQRRDDEIERGTIKAVSGPAALRRIRKKLA